MATIPPALWKQTPAPRTALNSQMKGMATNPSTAPGIIPAMIAIHPRGIVDVVAELFPVAVHALPGPKIAPQRAHFVDSSSITALQFGQDDMTSNALAERATTLPVAHRRARNPSRARCAPDESRYAPAGC